MLKNSFSREIVDYYLINVTDDTFSDVKVPCTVVGPINLARVGRDNNSACHESASTFITYYRCLLRSQIHDCLLCLWEGTTHTAHIFALRSCSLCLLLLSHPKWLAVGCRWLQLPITIIFQLYWLVTPG